MIMQQEKVENFFAFARERHAIYELRKDDQPWPWTDDTILRRYKFTNVFRELDRTTLWFSEHVRDRMRHDPAVLLATVVFRWFCKQEIGEVIFEQKSLLSGNETPWDLFLRTNDPSVLEHPIRTLFPNGPWVTGAYMIKSPTGMNKLTGILRQCQKFHESSNWRVVAGNPELTMKSFTEWLTTHEGQGPFLAYEVACDLRYTYLLERAPDHDTWANIGPGARRGLNRLVDRRNANPRNGKPKNVWGLPIKEPVALELMSELLNYSRREHYWPQCWPRWDMRTVEHTLCESDKYARVKNNEGNTPKQIYHRH